MLSVPEDLRQRLRQYDQEHVLAWWPQLDDSQRRELLGQVQTLDLAQLRSLYDERDRGFSLPPLHAIVPAPAVRLAEDDHRLWAGGEEALRRGEVAVLLVAGGQGSRLGFDKPKGMFPISPVRNKSLFQIHAEKLLALSRRCSRPIPFLIMTSDATHEDTETFFKEQRFFGLPQDEVIFFKQGTMPALDMATGRLLLEERGRLFAGPNGHGGTLLALRDSGQLEALRRRGVRHLFYFQVDNPLVKVADPLFLGHHLERRAEVSSKGVPKAGPADKMGVLVAVDGRCSIIEYSDLPEELAHKEEGGELLFRLGSPAIHIFDLDFLARLTEGTVRIPFHIARKKVPYLDEGGKVVQPARENALKFEMFIFDVLPLAERWSVVEADRRDEFFPLKNATGVDSPQTVRQALSNLAADWLERAGAAVPRTASGNAALALEVSPLLALRADDLAGKVRPGTRIEKETYLE